MQPVEQVAFIAGTAHGVLAIASVAAAIAVLVMGVLVDLGRSMTARWIDHVILLSIGATGLALLLGPVLLLTRGLSDPLHALYAIVALVALPLARILAAPETRAGARPSIDRRSGRWLALAAVSTLGALLRLSMTG